MTIGVNIQVPHTPSVTLRSVSSGSNAPETRVPRGDVEIRGRRAASAGAVHQARPHRRLHITLSRAAGGAGGPGSRQLRVDQPAHSAVWVAISRGPAASASAADAVAKVGDAALTFENSDPLQVALFDAEVLEQPPPVAEEDRDQVDLEFVEQPCG
jgi:hypothetical protein